MEAIQEYFSEKGVEWEPETAPDAVQPEAAWNKKTYPPVVHEGAVVALEKGMIEEYRNSWKLNVACKDAIEDAIRNNFDGMHLAPDVVQPVLEEYGQERLTYLLVSTLRQKREDGLFSRDNKVSDSKLREMQTANYFSNFYLIDCAVPPTNALFCRKHSTLLTAGRLL